jgi:hypothetical protein
MLGASTALLGWQRAVGVDLPLEPVEERLACLGGHSSTVMTGVHHMSSHSGVQAALLW